MRYEFVHTLKKFTSVPSSKVLTCAPLPPIEHPSGDVSRRSVISDSKALTKTQLDKHGNHQDHRQKTQIVIDAEANPPPHTSNRPQHNRDQAEGDQDRDDLDHMPAARTWSHCDDIKENEIRKRRMTESNERTKLLEKRKLDQTSLLHR